MVTIQLNMLGCKSVNITVIVQDSGQQKIEQTIAKHSKTLNNLDGHY